ncbi:MULTISPECIES: electron transfer flavoprotein subunit beta/FixA family protein [Thermocrispum]|jgi:electron transfer flavoprotein beta subunit|uniref:Electron transfer flavoprotein subunit beta/FixA family protein n=1 Tax=Thermocrispum agreste TaxID=37925 RepID=A0ABD6FFN0_9PSEU|nr:MULTISPECIES: electron transfer flavoprotein subunit beta/FixA family protein [Thermocrispum]
MSLDVLVCVKRVPAPGAKVPLTEDGRDIDTRHLGFTIGPHEECAVEEAVRLKERHGGSATVLAVGPPEVAEQVRYAIAMGADRGVVVDTGQDELDPQATAAAIVHALGELDARFDLIMFGNESADAGHYQVGVRVATELGWPIVGGIKGIEVTDGGVRLRREIADGSEVYQLSLPAAVAVKEGLNLPRYPSLPGRLKAKKAKLDTISWQPPPGGLRKIRLRQPEEKRADSVLLGHGPEAAPAVVDVLEELGVC